MENSNFIKYVKCHWRSSKKIRKCQRYSGTDTRVLNTRGKLGSRSEDQKNMVDEGNYLKGVAWDETPAAKDRVWLCTQLAWTEGPPEWTARLLRKYWL
jgi:hypothetical protein